MQPHTVLAPAKYTNKQQFIATENLILANQYRTTGRPGVTNESSANIWWHMPIFPANNPRSLTNNLRYWKNPDNGSCAPADFCGMYRDKHVSSNITHPLSPVPPGNGVRVGYYRVA